MKPLRIVALEATPINVPFNRPEVWSFGKVEGMTSIVVQIHTEDGSVGIGESVSGGPSIRVMLTAIQELAPLLEGQDATAITANLQRLTLAGGWHWYGRRTAVVLAGIEMALWDLLGKVRGEPVWRLLGYSASHKKTPYASQLFGDTPHETYQGAVKARKDGFRAVKRPSSAAGDSPNPCALARGHPRPPPTLAKERPPVQRLDFHP